jgi:hypothetical protein
MLIMNKQLLVVSYKLILEIPWMKLIMIILYNLNSKILSYIHKSTNSSGFNTYEINCVEVILYATHNYVVIVRDLSISFRDLLNEFDHVYLLSSKFEKIALHAYFN